MIIQFWEAILIHLVAESSRFWLLFLVAAQYLSPCELALLMVEAAVGGAILRQVLCR